MPAKVNVRIDDITGELQMLFDEVSSFLDLETGRVYSFQNAEIREAEEFFGEEEVEGLSEEEQILLRAATMDRMLPLPSKFDVHEWQIMKDFSNSLENREVQEKLSRALHGRGAFRHFKDAADLLGVLESWYAFRDAALRRIAIEWCDANGLEWT